MINNTIYGYGWGGVGGGDLLHYRRCGLKKQGLRIYFLTKKEYKAEFLRVWPVARA